MILSLACDTILIISQEALFCCPHRLHLFHSPQHSWGIRLFINEKKSNYEEYRKLIGKRETLWKRYRRAKTKEDKSEILAEINNIQPVIKELRKYDKYCKDIKDRSESMQNNLDNFDKDIQKEKENSINNTR